MTGAVLNAPRCLLYSSQHTALQMMTRLAERINYMPKETQLESKGARHAPRPCLIPQPLTIPLAVAPLDSAPGDQTHRTRYRECSGGCRQECGQGIVSFTPLLVSVYPLLLRPLALPPAICLGLSRSPASHHYICTKAWTSITLRHGLWQESFTFRGLRV